MNQLLKLCLMGTSLCAQCAKGKLGCKDCCTSPFQGDDPGFWLTLSDVARIVKSTNLEPDEFSRFTEVNDDDDEELEDKHVELMSTNDKLLMMNGKGKCFFLGENGCTIFNDRPKMCRIFPFWFKENSGKINITIQHENSKKEDECLITKTNFKNYDIEHLLGLINETQESMVNCIGEYLNEMKIHSKFKHELEKKTILDVLINNKFVDENIKVNNKKKDKIILRVLN
jgi:Fe-S-cluster containining protein